MNKALQVKMAVTGYEEMKLMLAPSWPQSMQHTRKLPAECLVNALRQIICRWVTKWVYEFGWTTCAQKKYVLRYYDEEKRPIKTPKRNQSRFVGHR